MWIARHGIIQSGIKGNLLLDSYPNAALAYSTRKLRSLYAGSAIRVRRSSDNTEQDIGFSGNNLDESALTTFIGANNGFITTWYDQSGNGRNATQTTLAAQPRIVNAGTIDKINNKPAIYFDGSNDTLNTPYRNVSEYSLFHAAVKITNDDFGIYINTNFDFAAIDGTNWGMLVRFNITGYANTIGNGYFTTARTSIANNTQALLYASLYSSLITHGRNGSTLNSTGVFGTMRSGTATAFYSGYSQELIIYPVNQSTYRTAIESNINSYYSIY